MTSANNTKEALDELFLKIPKNLSDVVSVGDYVAYNAGSWTETKAKPTSQGQFGGYTANQNKANSVACHESSEPSLKGWRVLSIDKSTNTVIIIHAGQPECYYHEDGYSTASITALNNRATSEYLNSDYANSAHMMNYDEANEIAQSSNLRTTGAIYWLASIYSNNRGLYRVSCDGSVNSIYSGNFAWGTRPVVVLKENIKTSGKTTDEVGNEAWNLITP